MILRSMKVSSKQAMALDSTGGVRNLPTDIGAEASDRGAEMAENAVFVHRFAKSL